MTRCCARFADKRFLLLAVVALVAAMIAIEVPRNLSKRSHAAAKDPMLTLPPAKDTSITPSMFCDASTTCPPLRMRS